MNRIINFFLALVGLCRVVGWQNIYLAGYYHRCGKPGAYDRHPGDLYPTRAQALSDINPVRFYLTTVKVVWYEEKQPHVNCAQSIPVPVSVSRHKLTEDGGEYIDGQWVAPPPVPSKDEIEWARAQANANLHW